LIDDTKDSDSTNTHDKEQKKAQPETKEVKTAPTPIEFDIEATKALICNLNTRAEINEHWIAHKELQANPDYVLIITERLKAIKPTTDVETK